MNTSAVAAVAAAVSIADARTEGAVLKRTVDVARSLLGTSFVAGRLTGADGQPATEELQGLAGFPPQWTAATETVGAGGTLRSVRPTGGPRDADSTSDGPGPSAMLAVPIMVDGDVLGGLYLGRLPGEKGFTTRDQDVAEALAKQSATAISRVRAGRAVDELVTGLHLTDRRAEDDPGSPGQPSVVVRRLLATARAVLGMELAFLSRIADGRQTFSLIEAGSGAPHLREGLTIDSAAGYCSLLLEAAIPASVPDVQAHPVMGSLPVTAELGVGGYCGVPVRLPDGSLYGTLCGLHPNATSAPSSAQVEALAIIAGLIGHSLQAEQELAQVHETRRAAFRSTVDGPGRRVVLQPIVDLTDGRTVGYEALSRFTDATGVPLSPDEVFQSARGFGDLIRLEQAAALSALSLLPRLPADTYLSINFSPVTLLDPETRQLLSRAAPTRLVVEVTEHEQVADYPAIRQALAPLRARGLRLAVDDTGAGFASLQHLTKLCPDIVKLDVAFVRDVLIDPACRAAARAVAGYAAEVGASLVAEGVETAEQATALRALGAGLGQGYFFSRPQAPDALFGDDAPRSAWTSRKPAAVF